MEPKTTMKLGWEFLSRRWLDMRNGHSTYLIFAMAFFQFTIITYALAIERLPLLKELFPSMTIWIISFIVVYIPSAIIVGHFHIKKQVPAEVRQFHDNNPFTNFAAPGKELLLSIPAAIISYEMQLKNMRISNQQADAWKQAFGIEVESYQTEEFIRIKQLLETYKRLQKGESIAEIAKV